MRTPPVFHWFKDSILLIALALAACGGGGSAGLGDAPTVVAEGLVVDDQGVPLASASVTVVSSSTATGTDTRVTTDSEGRFRLTLDAGTPAVIRVDKTGYAPGFRAAGDTGRNGVVASRVVMLPVASTQTFDPTQEAVLRVPGSTSRVTLPANALVRTDGQPLSGEVTVSLTPVDPSVDVARMPGLMVDAGSGEPIESLGALGVTFTDASGAPLNLASGQSATLRIAATPAPGATLPATFPLYHLNERTGQWEQEGQATLKTDEASGQSYYEGTASHFSWWNADQVITRTTLNIGVTTSGLACTVPPGMHVMAQGLDYNGRSFPNGTLTPVRANSRVSVQLLDTTGDVVDSLELDTGTAGLTTGLPRCLSAGPQVTVSGLVNVSSGTLSNYRVQLSGERTTAITLPIDANGRYSTRLYGNRGTVRARLVSGVDRGTPDTMVSATVATQDVQLPDLTVSDTTGELSGCLQGWETYRQRGIVVSLFAGDAPGAAPLGLPTTLRSTNARFTFPRVPLNRTLTLRLTPPDATLAERSVSVVMDNASVDQSICLDLPRGPEAQMRVTGTGRQRSFDASASTAAPDAPVRTVRWDFGDGTTATGSLETPSSHSYANDGNYTARLTLTDSLGQQSSTTVPVIVVSTTANVASARQVASGELHTCYINAQGGVACEGYDGYGQLGSGELFAPTQPTAVVGLSSGVREVAAGGDFSCALTQGGAVYCWGANGFAQLGPNGQGSYSATPVQVTGLGDGVQAISAGRAHACAITRSGGIKCWGANDSGQLGNGSVSNTPSATPQDVEGLTEGVVALGLGGSQSCAATAAGLYCWGRDTLFTEGFVRSSPDVVSGAGEGVRAIAAGDLHVCVVTQAGAVKCRGENTDGQLGTGDQLSSLTAVQVSGATQGFVDVSAGPSHTCALSTEGITHCWGRNAQGQLGNGSTSASLVPVIATEQSAAAIGVSARGYSTCTLRSNRSLQCWGWLEGYAPGG